MTKSAFDDEDGGYGITVNQGPMVLGLLCRRRHFPTFDALVLCLIEVDSSVEIIFNAMVEHLKSYEKCLNQDISPGSRGINSLFLRRGLLDSNPAVTKYEDSLIIHTACIYLRKGEISLCFHYFSSRTVLE
jgi:hypothetical protein